MKNLWKFAAALAAIAGSVVNIGLRISLMKITVR